MSLAWRVAREGELVDVLRDVVEEDSIRGEVRVVGQTRRRIKAIVRLASLDTLSVIQGLVPNDSIVLYTDDEILENDSVVWRGSTYSIVRVQPSESISKCYAKVLR
ncbi:MULTISPECIES: hypothetical protein [unclassified Mesotoga]|uniref:hypothetical protein n=1 Tax=unclassified Mesotoga TaxID=1184398 RepID=UPI000DA6C232|nr:MULTISPECIES: hypothetical protein [unclassified Mesotoga]PZC52321.1 hypothetical protein LH53_05760 [Mesotoga sp. TolDC]